MMDVKLSSDIPYEKGEILEQENIKSKDSDGLSITDAARGDNLPDSECDSPINRKMCH